MALAMARRMGTKKMSDGGKCYACGGVANPELKQSHMASGGLVDEEKEGEGGGVDSYDETSLMDADSDSDDLEYSPEVAEGTVDNEEDDDNEAKRASFLRAYLIHRKVQRG